MMFICENCVRPPFVKEFFRKNKNKYLRAKCYICDKTSNNNISLDIFGLRNILRAAIRYYYDESIYNTHLGGEDLEAIFYSNNFVFNHPIYNKEKAKELSLCIQENFITNPSDGVSLYYGHVNGMRWAFRSIRNTNYIYNKNMTEIKRKKKWILEDISFAEKMLKKNMTFFRGRPEYDYKKHFFVHGEKFYDNIKVPFCKKKDMGPPPPRSANESRFNIKGVSRFYLSSDIRTVIAELKPELELYLSIGAFRLIKKAQVIDVTQLNFYNFCENDKMLERYVLLNDLNNLFAKPINKQTKEEYKKTQFIAELFKKACYEGIVYKSSVSTGKNYCFFSDKKFVFINNSARLFKVKKIYYTINKVINKVHEDAEIDGFFRACEKELSSKI